MATVKSAAIFFHEATSDGRHLNRVRFGYTHTYGATTSRFRRGLAIRGRYSRAVGAGWRSLGRIRRNIVAAVIGGGRARELLPAFFFLLFFLRQIPLAFFELVVWFGQEISFDRRKGRMERC